jgi:lysophospholipase L1-like esterase
MAAAHRTLIGSIIGFLAISLASCSSDGGDTTPTTTSSSSVETTTTTDQPILQSGDKYVSLGSSLASGFGIAVQSESCGRSSRNLGQLIAAEFELALTDVSCGAAVIPNVLDTAQGQAQPQIEFVGADTKLITVVIGGNDIGFNGTALVCGDPNSVCTAPPALAENEAALEGKLVTMLNALQAKAPDAVVVLVTYPREFPIENCPALSLTDEELSMLRDMGDALQNSLVAAAQQTGVLLVDPYSVDADHTACAPESERWTSGYTVATGEGFAYHPTALGHQAMASLVIDALNAL